MKTDMHSNSLLYEVKLSEWFDWMRKEITQGGIDLPNEETSVLFAAKAMQLASRLRGVYRHVSTPLESVFIQSAIVFQCWQEQKQILAGSHWQGAPHKARSVDVVRIIRTIGGTGRRHLILASDGFQYVVTLCSGSSGDTIPATEWICNELARMVGLHVPEAAVVTFSAKLAGRAHAAWAEWPNRRNSLTAEVCCGFRYLDCTSQNNVGVA